jgi:AMIN domain
MKKWVHIPVMASLLGAALVVSATAAELLDVKSVGSGASTAIEVSADIPMTYTYYKIPGQARAVVDIADADPEKVEPLIVVNKGAIASISVDKAMLGDMTVSRLVFNLVTETDIAVKQSADKKILMVSFGAGNQAAVEPAPVAVAAPVAIPAPVEPASAVKPAPVEKAAAAAAPVVETKTPTEVQKQAAKEEEDPLGLDEQQPAPTSVAKPVAQPAKPAKLEPVVPAVTASEVIVKGIVVGASYIDIQTSAPVEKFKQLKLSKPERLAIEIAGTSKVKVQTIQVKRFGISKVRVGSTPGVVRLVLDSTAKAFPAFEATTIDNGVRITFK